MSERPKPHLVYIAFFFPPSRASGVYRALATANVFRSKGWEVTVITSNEEFYVNEIGTYDASLLKSIDKGISVIRVPFSFGSNAGERSNTRLKSVFLRIQRKVKVIFANVLGRFLSPAKADNYYEWVNPAVSALLEVNENKRVSHILATGNPFSSFEVAYRCHKAIEVPFSIDYRDPWTLNVYSGEKLPVDKRVDALEKRIVESASNIFHVNEAMSEKNKTMFPKTVSNQFVVPNGFDLDSIASRRRNTDDGAIVFGILGTLNPHWPIKEILQAWNNIAVDLPQGSCIKLGGYLGYFAHSEKPLSKLLPADSSNFEYVGPIEKGNIKAFYESLDAIIIPASGGPMVTTGKVYEVAAQPHPILCIQGEGGGARMALAGRPHVHSCEAIIESLEDAMRKTINSHFDMTQNDILKMQKFAASFERQLSLEKLFNHVQASI
ncbi:MAG: hypothetical protein VX754_01935 [Actinomycetota bacterium]|nr:hypothetical protein [Actinomycetota bacterium]